MDKKNLFSCLSFTLIILILLTHMSTVLSSRNMLEEEPNYFNSNDIVYHQNEILSCDHLAYIGIDDDSDCWLSQFVLFDPGNLTCKCIDENVTCISYGSWTNNGTIIAFMTHNNYEGLVEINPLNCEINYICRDTSGFLGLAYDPITGMLYTSSNHYLLRINPETCELETIGYFGSHVFYMVGMAFNSDGILYGWDLLSELYTINTETGHATNIGLLGIDINSRSDGHFCFEHDILYIAANGRYLLKNWYPIGQFEGDSYITLLTIPYGYNDTTPPETTLTLDPPDPDGENGWYVSNVTVNLTAIDDYSGVKDTLYRINGIEWRSYDCPFILYEDGKDILIEFYSFDYEGNKEQLKSVRLDIDKTPPDPSICYEITGGNCWQGWEITFTIPAYDNTSGSCYVEFYINDVIQETVTGAGPTYSWSLIFFPTPNWTLKVIAFDCAGNYAEAIINGSDIKASSTDIFSFQYSSNFWFLRFFERFQFLEVFLRIIKL
ncbi:MAG: hypothetical protein JSU91_07725 [Thermoplasmatales archaeon]|nr:MAG: hypothetical protein JSU91_07725 [Thermoplasmatales archaeon]